MVSRGILMTTNHQDISPEEILRRKEETRQALTNLRLESITPSKEMINDLELLDTGKMTAKEFIKSVFVRLNLPVPTDHGN